MSSNLDDFEMELKAAFDALSFEDIEIRRHINEQVIFAKQRMVYIVEGWQLDDLSESYLYAKIADCETMGDIENLQTLFFHFAPPPSVFKNVSRINADGKQYWTNAFIDYRKRNGTF